MFCNLTCNEARPLALRLIDGEMDETANDAVLKHMATCPSCGAEFGFDLALIASIRTSPEAAFASVSGEVVRRVRRHERRVFVLRWGSVVAGVSLVGILVGTSGVRIFNYLSALVSSGRSGAEFMALAKIVATLRLLVEGLSAKVVGGALSADLSPYHAQIMIMTAGAVVLVVSMMYLMGLWLRKPMEVKSCRRDLFVWPLSL